MLRIKYLNSLSSITVSKQNNLPVAPILSSQSNVSFLNCAGGAIIYARKKRKKKKKKKWKKKKKSLCWNSTYAWLPNIFIMFAFGSVINSKCHWVSCFLAFITGLLGLDVYYCFLHLKKKKALSCYKFVALMLCTKEEKGTCSRRLTCNADDSNPVSAG